MITSSTTVGVEWRADFRLLEVGLLAVDHDADLEVDDAVLAEARNRLAGLRVERDEAVAGGDVDDAIVTLAVGPVGESAARQLARRPARGALALVHAVGPLQLAGARLHRDHRAARAGRGIEHPLDHDGRAFELGFGTRTEVVGLQAPRHFELADVAAVDLIERRVLRAAEVRGVHRPLAVLGARHRAGLAGDERGHPRVDGEEQHQSGHGPNCDAVHAIFDSCY